MRAHSPGHDFAQVLHYATLPAGKLFRSQLVYCVAQDLGAITPAHRTLASSIEIHHAYTLVHDDLPCMDDDDLRRGKPSTHRAFGEWKAVLAGDAMMGVSLSCLASLPAQKLPWLLKFYGFCTGPKGLILGQCLDMGGEINRGPAELLRTHELKTGRLIQLSLVGSAHLSLDLNLTNYKQFMRLGRAIGITFQLLDDYQELSEPLGAHESEINPFLKYGKQKILTLALEQQRLSLELCQQLKLESLAVVLRGHYEKFGIR